MDKSHDYVFDYINFNIDIDDFYRNKNNIDFKNITAKKLIELKCFSKKFNNYWKNAPIKDIRYKYITIMNKIKTAPFKYRVTNEAEKFILFMYSIDPTFEVYKIWNEYNTTKEIKNSLLNKFGLVDKNLYIIEKYFIHHFLSMEKQNEIEEEINNRIYKK